jgi:hypothetical protein
MRLFFSQKSLDSFNRFENGLEDYFKSAFKLRTSMRTGTIVLLDDKRDMASFLVFLIEHCDLRASVVRLDQPCCAKKTIQEIGGENVKAVIMQSGFLGNSLNGDSLPQWLSSNYPEIPLWVMGCDGKTRDWIRSHTLRIGIFDEKDGLSKVAEAMGVNQELADLMPV